MARYIDAKIAYAQMRALYEHHIEMRNFSADGAVSDCLKILDDTPTADVVPKREVDEIVRQWKEEANCWQNNYITELRDNEQIKAEVTREIFEEIEKLTPKKFTEKSQDFEFGYALAIQQIKNEIAELKKKYTEGE